MKNDYGYSVIELMITLTIIAILLGYAIPSFYEVRQNSLMSSQRNRLSTSFNLARYKAIMEQKIVVVCPSISGIECDNSANWHQGWIIFDDDNKNRRHDDGEFIYRFEDPMPEGLTALSSIHRQKIRFNAMGFSPGTNVSINFCDVRGDKAAASVIINNAGRIKQSRPIRSNVCN